MVYDNAGEMRGTGGGTRGLRHFHGSGGWSYPHPPYRSDTDELLEAVVTAGFGGVEGAIRVDPGAMDAASDELPRCLALLPPAPDLGPVALPDLDAGAAGDVEGAIGVEGDPIGVVDVLLQADERALGGEDLPAMVFTIHHVDEVVVGDQEFMRHVELAGKIGRAHV